MLTAQTTTTRIADIPFGLGYRINSSATNTVL